MVYFFCKKMMMLLMWILLLLMVTLLTLLLARHAFPRVTRQNYFGRGGTLLLDMDVLWRKRNG